MTVFGQEQMSYGSLTETAGRREMLDTNNRARASSTMIANPWSPRHAGVAFGVIVTYEVSHLTDAVAFGLKATTLLERLGAVSFGVAVLLTAIFLVRKLFSRAFLHGFVVASGTILSFDIVLFHWIFQLHRITDGPEADLLEPILVLSGVGLIWWGIRCERNVNVGQ